MKNEFCRRILIASFVFLVNVFAYSEAVNSMQLYKADSWVYRNLVRLGVEGGVMPVTVNAPLTAGEIRIYFSEIDREKLSDSGKELYDELEDFLYEKPKNFSFADFSIAPNLMFTPEFYAKTNKEIDWTYNYFYRDNSVSGKLFLAFSDFFLFDVEIFLGKNYSAMHNPNNFSNMVFSISDFEFQTPRWANFSAGYNFPNWGFNLIVGKEGLQIGRTLMGSIVYNNTFMTDMFAQFNIYTHVFKFTMNLVEVSVNKIFYEHQFEARFFKKFRLELGEGALVSGPFEPRFLLPLTMFHSYAGWRDYNEEERKFYSESRFCNTLNIMLDYAPIPTSRFYLYYTQNELQTPWEDPQTPNSFGYQLGTESNFPAPGNGYWLFGLEGVWTTPYLYIKHGAPWSLYREYRPNHGGGPVDGNKVCSWIGSPYGPDCLGGAVKFGYEKSQKWICEVGWVFTAHGDNNFDMFYNPDNINEDGYYTYYPSVKYDHATSDEEREAALSDALYLFPSGIIEYKNQAAIKGTYNFNRHFSLSGQVVYIFAFNYANILDNFQQGVEFTISGKYNLF